MNDNKKLLRLLEEYFSGYTSIDDKKELNSFYDRIDVESPKSDECIYDIQSRVKQRLFKSIGIKKSITIVRKIRWTIAAASIVLVFSIAGYFIVNSLEKEVSETMLTQIVPMHKEAVIQLQNGETINLDTLTLNQTVKVGDILITKDAEGKVSYRNARSGKVSVQQNTLIVPKYSTYKLTLTDGTMVTLNADSKLTYPSSFEGNERVVSLEGEAYFEVNKQTNNSTFIVKGDNQEVRVLGTKFNVKTFGKSQETRTSLVEGSVLVRKSADREILLKPNQQAINGATSIDVVIMDEEHVLSWMQDQFYFNGQNATEVLEDIASWYDIDIECNKIPDYKGVIPRSLPLNKLIELLKYTDVNIKAVVGKENKVKLIIS